MFKGIEVHELSPNINLYTLKTSQFKTDSVGIFFERQLSEDEASKNAMLMALMRRGTEKYPMSRDLYRALDSLYGAVYSTSISKYGERQIIKFQMQFPDSNYIEDENIFEKCISMLNEIVNHPYTEGDSFPNNYFEQEKKNQIIKLENRINNKMAYAFDRCIEEMFKGEPFAVNEDGELKHIMALDEKSLYEHYLAVLATSKVDIFIVSRDDRNHYSGDILKLFEFKNEETKPIPREKHIYPLQSPKNITEKMDIAQGKLVMGFRTNIAYEDAQYRSLLVFNEILGGGSYSKLFRNIREKESLCYSIFSTVEKFKSALFIASGIDFEKKDRVVDLILEQVEEMKQGLFDEEDLENAKKSIISSINSIKDSPNKIINYYYSRILTHSYMEAEEIIRQFEAIDKASVLKAAEGIFLDTVYFLDKKGEQIEKN